MRVCKNCKIQVIDDEARFCIECGADLNSISHKSSNTTSQNHSLQEKENILQSPSKNIQKIVKGQKVSLANFTQNSLVVSLSFECDKNFDIDASAFLLNQQGQVISDDDIVFYNNLRHKSGCLECKDSIAMPKTFLFNLIETPAEYNRIAFTLTINDAEIKNQNFSQVNNMKIVITDSIQPDKILIFSLDDALTVENALLVAEIYRHKGEWKFNAIGAGFSGGLVALCKNFGVDVDTK